MASCRGSALKPASQKRGLGGTSLPPACRPGLPSPRIPETWGAQGGVERSSSSGRARRAWDRTTGSPHCTAPPRPRPAPEPQTPCVRCTCPWCKPPPAGHPFSALRPLFPCLRNPTVRDRLGALIVWEFTAPPSGKGPRCRESPSPRPGTFMLPVELTAAGCLLPQTEPQTAPAQSYVLGPGQPPWPRPLSLQSPPLPSHGTELVSASTS